VPLKAVLSTSEIPLFSKRDSNPSGRTGKVKKVEEEHQTSTFFIFK
jgi:hypothetical protein